MCAPSWARRRPRRRRVGLFFEIEPFIFRRLHAARVLGFRSRRASKPRFDSVSITSVRFNRDVGTRGGTETSPETPPETSPPETRFRCFRSRVPRGPRIARRLRVRRRRERLVSRVSIRVSTRARASPTREGTATRRPALLRPVFSSRSASRSASILANVRSNLVCPARNPRRAPPPPPPRLRASPPLAPLCARRRRAFISPCSSRIAGMYSRSHSASANAAGSRSSPQPTRRAATRRIGESPAGGWAAEPKPASGFWGNDPRSGSPASTLATFQGRPRERTVHMFSFAFSNASSVLSSAKPRPRSERVGNVAFSRCVASAFTFAFALVVAHRMGSAARTSRPVLSSPCARAPRATPRA